MPGVRRARGEVLLLPFLKGLVTTMAFFLYNFYNSGYRKWVSQF